MKVHWTHRAKARLKHIQDYVAQDKPQVAREVVEKILRKSWQLSDLPNLGHAVKGYSDTDLREVMIRPYRLIYCIKATQIDIITVLHYRQLLPKDLQNLLN